MLIICYQGPILFHWFTWFTRYPASGILMVASSAMYTVAPFRFKPYLDILSHWMMPCNIPIFYT